jgi:signal transduction histidine kinase
LDRFVGELTALLRLVNDGGSGLDAVRALVELTQRAVGAVGVSFAEYGVGGGRVIAGSGESAWAVGRPVDPTEPVTARLIAAGPVAEVSVDEMPTELAGHLSGRGLRRMLAARAELAGTVVGTLHAYFRDEGVASDRQRALIGLLAAAAGHLYADGRGLLLTTREVTEAPGREQARDLFVAVTSHELLTPVTVIKGYADTLVDHWDELDETSRRDAVTRLDQRAGELARLVGRLLAAVGDGAGQRGVRPFDLAEALYEAVAELPDTVRPRIQLLLPDGLPQVRGELATIGTVLSELVTNAGKYAPAESSIELSALADARTVCFRVADRGVGVRPEHVERAFERFWQAESGDQRRYGGVGLGLYLVRRMVERQNGWVSLRPREHGGTVAEVRFLRADLGPGEA